MLGWATPRPGCGPGWQLNWSVRVMGLPTSYEDIEPAPLCPCHQGQFSFAGDEGCGHLSHEDHGQLSCCSVQGEAGPGSPRPAKGGTISGIALWFDHAWLLWPPEGTQAIDINPNPSCSLTMGPDIALGSSLGQDSILAPSGYTGHSDQWHDPWPLTRPQVVAPNWVSVWPLVTIWDMNFRKTTTVVEPWTQTLSSAAARSGCHYCPRWQCSMVLRPQHDQAWSSHTAFDYNRSNRCQLRPWLP